MADNNDKKNKYKSKFNNSKAEKKRFSGQDFSNRFTVGFRLFGVMMIFLVFVSLYRVSEGLPVPTFSSFLEMLAEVPSIDIPLRIGAEVENYIFQFSGTSIAGNIFWEVFAFLFVDPIDLLIWSSEMIAQCLTFIFYITEWVLVQ